MYREDFAGCCGIEIITDFPLRPSKADLIYAERGYEGGLLLVALTTGQTAARKLVLANGYKALETFVNSGTGNKITLFSKCVKDEPEVKLTKRELGVLDDLDADRFVSTARRTSLKQKGILTKTTVYNLTELGERVYGWYVDHNNF